MDNKSIAHKLYDILHAKLEAEQIKTEEDIISILETEQSQITGKIAEENTDDYMLFFSDSSVLKIKLECEGDIVVGIDYSHGYRIKKNQLN
jgi:hypothetical protein